MTDAMSANPAALVEHRGELARRASSMLLRIADASDGIAGIESAALDRVTGVKPAMTLSSPRTLLEAVRHIHLWGYESVRVHAYLYATGHWRCELGEVGSPARDGRPDFRYSSGSDWDYFGDAASGPVTPEVLARRMLEQRPGLTTLRAPATAYTVWFSALLDQCGPSGVFALSDDSGYDAVEAGYVRLIYATVESANAAMGSRFPLSPVF